MQMNANITFYLILLNLFNREIQDHLVHEVKTESLELLYVFNYAYW